MTFLDHICLSVAADYRETYKDSLILTCEGEVMTCEAAEDGDEAIVHVAFPGEPWLRVGQFNDTDHVSRAWRRHTFSAMIDVIHHLPREWQGRYAVLSAAQPDKFLAASQTLRDFAINKMVRRSGGAIERIEVVLPTSTEGPS